MYRIEPGKAFQWLTRKTVVRYSRTMAQFCLFACHLADLKGEYSVNFDELHSLSNMVEPLAACALKDPRSPETMAALSILLLKLIEYQGSLANSLQHQYIVFHFLALRHLRTDGGFPPAIDVTQALAHLQWGFRLVMFIKIRQSLTQPRDGYNEMDLLRTSLSCLHVGKSTQMGTIHSMKGVLRWHAEHHPRATLARWDDLTYTRLYCEGKQFALDVFRAMNMAMLLKAENLLKELLLGDPLDSWLNSPNYIHDNESAVGDLYSFLIDPRNKLGYLNSAFAKQALQHFTVATVGGAVQSRGVSTYLSKCRTMLELIAGMMHLTSGGAPRAEEAIQTRILEGKEGKRNLFWIRGKLAWVLEYNKSKSQSVGRFQFVKPKSLTLFTSLGCCKIPPATDV